MNGFERFWAAYPKKVGKLMALKSYARALRIASDDVILAGVERYKEHLPDDPQFICHASTFLNQGRWMDEYDTEPVKPKVSKVTAQILDGMRGFGDDRRRIS